jgi:ABC-type sugar transport system ATPase subunit
MVLQAAGVLKSFPGVRALDHVSVSVAEGEVHALIGGNGAGKSTLVKLFSGAYQPDGGELRYLGEQVSFGNPLQAMRAGIATIYQKGNLAPQMSIARNIFLGREPRGRFGLIDFARMHAVAEEILTGYGVRADVRRPVASLRGRHPADGRPRAGRLGRGPRDHHGRAHLVDGAGGGGDAVRRDLRAPREQAVGDLRQPSPGGALPHLRPRHGAA